MNHPPLAPGSRRAASRARGSATCSSKSGEAIVDYRAVVRHARHARTPSARNASCLPVAHRHAPPPRFPDRPRQGARPGALVRDRPPTRSATACRPRPRTAPPSRACAFRASPCATWSRRSTGCSTEHLGIERLHAVVGASMGGMQALQWAVSHPALHAKHRRDDADGADRAVGGARHRGRARCLMADPAWTGDGFSRRPERGWRAYSALMSALSMRTPSAVARLASARRHAVVRRRVAQQRRDAVRRRTTSSTSRGPTRRTTSAPLPASAATPRRRSLDPAAALALARRSTCSTRRRGRAAAAAMPGGALRRDSVVAGPPGGDHLGGRGRRFLESRDRRVPRLTARGSGVRRRTSDAREVLPPGGDRAERQHRGRAGQAGAQAAGAIGDEADQRRPTIWPAANTIVKAAMPAGHGAGGRLWRTSAVVEATSDRKTAPNSRPEANTASGCVLSTGSSVASASSALRSASDSPPRKRCSIPAQSHDEAMTREAEQRVERRDQRRRELLLAQQRDDEGHVADVAEAEQEVGGEAGRERRASANASALLRAAAGAARGARVASASERGRDERERAERRARPAARRAPRCRRPAAAPAAPTATMPTPVPP